MKKLLVCLVLAGAIGAAYYNALGNDFVFDDYMLVVESPVVNGSQPLAHFLASPDAGMVEESRRRTQGDCSDPAQRTTCWSPGGPGRRRRPGHPRGAL